MVEIVIGDGQPLVVDLFASVLTAQGYAVVEAWSTPARVLEGVRRRRPHLCLVDHRSLAGRERGRFLEDLLVAAGDHTRVVVVSSGPAGPAADSAGALRVDGVLDKRADLDTLLGGLHRVLSGEVVTETRVPPEGWVDDSARYQRMAASLTARERECLELIVDGRSTGQIGGILSISVTTVRSHVRSLLIKLGVHSRLEAAALVGRYGLLGDVHPSRAG